MADSQSTIDNDEHHRVRKLNLRGLPPIYVLAAHLSINEQHEAEDALSNSGASLTYDIKEANIVLGNISKPRRAKSELLWKGILVEDIEDVGDTTLQLRPKDATPARKRRKLKDKDKSSEFPARKVDVVITDSSTASETEDDEDTNTEFVPKPSLSRVSTSSDGSSPISMAAKDTHPPVLPASLAGRVKVIRLEWLNDSLSDGKGLPLEPYAVYTGRLVPPQESATNPPATMKGNRSQLCMGNRNISAKEGTSREIIDRAHAQPRTLVNRYMKRDRIKDAANKDFVGRSFSSSTQVATQRSSQPVTRPTHLLHRTTSEHDEAASSALPPMPDWVRENKIYACERATPLRCPNQAFICLLKEIKLARLLTLDEIGVRAYSSSIASLAAYPHPIQSTGEILALPSCDQKIAHLFHEYHSDGKIQAVADIQADPVLKVLREFYQIWGIGAKTAREFYYDKGWRDLDDIVENGWKSLSRVQQIGLKYYEYVFSQSISPF